jgi:hypothetical protein
MITSGRFACSETKSASVNAWPVAGSASGMQLPSTVELVSLAQAATDALLSEAHVVCCAHERLQMRGEVADCAAQEGEAGRDAVEETAVLALSHELAHNLLL